MGLASLEVEVPILLLALVLVALGLLVQPVVLVVLALLAAGFLAVKLVALAARLVPPAVLAQAVLEAPLALQLLPLDSGPQGLPFKDRFLHRMAQEAHLLAHSKKKTAVQM